MQSEDLARWLFQYNKATSGTNYHLLRRPAQEGPLTSSMWCHDTLSEKEPAKHQAIPNAAFFHFFLVLRAVYYAVLWVRGGMEKKTARAAFKARLRRKLIQTRPMHSRLHIGRAIEQCPQMHIGLEIGSADAWVV